MLCKTVVYSSPPHPKDLLVGVKLNFGRSWNYSLLQMKTVSVALVLCLNVGVDPPDVVKTSPCARLECWIGRSTNTTFIVLSI